MSGLAALPTLPAAGGGGHKQPATRPSGRWAPWTSAAIPTPVAAAAARARADELLQGISLRAAGRLWRVRDVGGRRHYWVWVPAARAVALGVSGAPGDCPQTQGSSDEETRCFDCTWIQQLGLGAPVSRGGARVGAFALGQSDPFDALAPAQQQWVLAALMGWIGASSPGICSQVAAGQDLGLPQARVNAVACFQAWYNAGALLPTGASFNAAGAQIGVGALGTLTQDTLSQLVQVMGNAPGYAGVVGAYPAGGTAAAPSKMSTGAKIALGTAGVLIVGGLVVAAARSRS